MILSKKLKRKATSVVMCLMMVTGLMPLGVTNVKAAAAEVNIASGNVEAGGTIASAGKATFKALQALTRSDKSAVSVGDYDYTYTLKSNGANNAKVDGATGRAFGVVTTEADAEVAIVTFMGAGKKGYVIESETELPVTADKSAPVAFTAENAVATLAEGSTRTEFTAKAGNYYYLIGVGTNLEVYDFEYVREKVKAGNAEDFTFIMDNEAVDGIVATGERKYGDSSLILGGQTVNGSITQYTVKSGQSSEIDGVSHNAYTSGKRHADANNIPTLPGEGDGCLAVFTPAAEGMMTVYFSTTSFIRIHDFNTDGTKNGYTDSEIGLTQYSFAVEPGHSYVMSTTGKTNNMFYAGYKYIVNNEVNVNINVTNVDASTTDSLVISAVDAQLGGKAYSLHEGTNTVKLLKGHTYKVSSNDGGVKPLVGDSDSFTVSDDAVEVTLNNVPDVTLSGSIVGMDDVSKLTSLTFTNMVSGVSFDATVSGSSYEVSVKPGEYNAAVVTTDGGVTYDRASVQAGEENKDDVYVEYADPASKRDIGYADIPNLNCTGNVAVETGKTHTVAKQDSTITIPVSGQARVIVKAYYAAGFTINGEEFTCASGTTSTVDSYEKVVDGDAVITFTAPSSYLTGISVIPMHEFKSELNVPGDYDTLNEASDAILGMTDRPEGEAGRVTINLNKDLEEQTVMAAPYVTLKGNGHTIQWYYGVGTKYYSVDSATGLFNKTLYMDKYSSAEGNGNLWGGVFIVRGSNFIAEDTTFKNTYNYEVTETEKTDIAGSLLNGVDRLAEGADAAAYKFKERSNAFYIDADNIEVYNCKILSSQDTLGRNGSTNYNFHTYFKDCVIGGNVDYICGEFSAVFDNCELQWKTYSNSDAKNTGIGYITAAKTSPYVFRNCTVTTDGQEGSATVLGKLGRTWGAGSNASFIDVETNGLIDDDGWGEMSSGEKASAIFNEYNLTSNGEAFSTTGATSTTEDAVANYIDTDTQTAVDTVLGGWTPVHYPAVEPETVEYTIIEGADQTVKEGNDVTVRSDAPYAKFVKVLVDGEEVAAENYAVSEGSTIIDLKAAYVDTLAAGKHTLTVVSEDGEASTTFTVVKNDPAPTPSEDPTPTPGEDPAPVPAEEDPTPAPAEEDPTPDPAEEQPAETSSTEETEEKPSETPVTGENDAKAEAPATGVSSHTALYLLLLAGAAAVLAGLKKKFTEQ